VVVTEQRADAHHESLKASLEEQARAKGLRPVESIEDLDEFALDVWESDEDLRAFLADVRASRDADVA
jgi:hypothetical protein